MTDSIPKIPPAALADLNRRIVRDSEGTMTFIDDHGFPLMHLDKEGCPNYSPQDTVAWSRVAHPELWGTETSPPAAEAAKSSAPTTASEIMLAVRAGTMTAADASTALAKLANTSTMTAHVATTPTTTNASALFAAAKAGDAQALAKLKSHLGLSR